MIMIVFTLGSDSGFQIGADGILDDYDDESGISVVLWCIIFLFLLVVTVWFYITQLTPRSAKCVDDEDEDEEERVANKLLNHLGAGKCNPKPSSTKKGNDICKPSTSSQNSDNYEVIDGEIRIHHSSYEWQDESCSNSKGNESGVREMSDSLVRRPSMEEMSLIFPGFLPSITEEEEEEEDENQEKYKEEELFDRSVCKITKSESDTVESCPNKSSNSNVYEPIADVHSTIDNSDMKNLDQENSKLIYEKFISGRQITNKKGKQPAQTSRVTAEIRLRTRNVSQVYAVSSKDDKSRQDETVQAFKPAGSGPEESDINENKVSVLESGKTAFSSQNMKSLSLVSGSKTCKFDPMEQSLDSNTSGCGFETHKKALVAGKKDLKTDKNHSEFLEDAKNELSISASMNSNCYVNRNSNEVIVCIETNANLQNEPDGDLNNPEDNNNNMKKSSTGSTSKEIDLSLSNGLKNTTFRDSNNMSNHSTHAWTFYSVLESSNDLDDINGDNKESNSLVEKQDQTQKIPKIVVNSYGEEKTSSNKSNLENDTWTQFVGQIDSFETDIDVDEVDLEEKNEGSESEEGELNMFLKRHVSVTDLDKVLPSNESAQDENDFETNKFASDLAEEANLETIVRAINISDANKTVYTESSLDDIWDEDECNENRTVDQSIEMSENTLKTRSSENGKLSFSGTSEFFSRQTVWTTLDQITDNSKEVKEDEKDTFGSDMQKKCPTEKKETEIFFPDATGLSKNLTSSAKVERGMGRKTKNDIFDDANEEENDDHSEVRSLEENIPELMKGGEEENISSGPITIHTFEERCEQVNTSFRTLHDRDESKKLNHFVEREVMLERVTSQDKDSSQNITKQIAGKPESAVEFGRAFANSDFLERNKPESTKQDSLSTEVKRIPELRKTDVLESIVAKDLESKVLVVDESTKKQQEDGIVLDGRKENGASLESGSGRIELVRPASPRGRHDVIYGRRKTKNDGSGKRAEFILRLNETSPNREHSTSPYTSDSDVSDVSQNGSAGDVADILSADKTRKVDVNLRGEHLSKTNKQDKLGDVTQSSDEVRYSTVMHSDKGIKKSSTSVDSTTKDIDKVTEEDVTNVTRSSATIEPEVDQPLESAQLPSGEIKAKSEVTEKQDDSDKGSLVDEKEDASTNYRVQRRDVQPKFEKSFAFNPEKKQLQTLITIDQVPDTHIGLKICMTGSLDVEQKQTMTGLEKAEQIVANRMKRIEAEKKAAEENKGKEKVNQEASKETKSRNNVVPRKARYDETRYRRTDQGRNAGLGKPVDERISPEEPIPRKIQWNDFKLDEVVLEEFDASEKCARNDASDDIDFYTSNYEQKSNIKKFDSAEQMVTEDVTSETFSPREIDWTLLDELRDNKSEVNKESSGNNKGMANISSFDEKKEEAFSDYLDSELNKYHSKCRKISLEKDGGKESTKVVALVKLSTPSLQKEIPSEKTLLTENNTPLVVENKEQYYQKTRLDLDKKKRSDDLKKNICDKLSNLDLEVDESQDQESNMSTPSNEQDFPMRLTKSFSELRSMDREKRDAGASRLSERSADPSTPRDPGVSSEDDEVFSDSPRRVFKTKVTVDEVRGNKRRITILNIRKKSPGGTRWKSLNDIDTLSTAPKQIFKFTSISSLPEEEKGPRMNTDASQKSEIKETTFAVSGLIPTDELDSANKNEEKRPTPSKAPQESYGSRISSSEGTFISSARDNPVSNLNHKDEDTEGRSISPKETMFVASPQSPTPSSDTGYHSREDKTGLQRQSPLSPVTIQASRSSSTGRIFKLSRHSPTPLSDSETKTRENVHVQRQSSLSPETVQKSRRSQTGTIFALSRHSPTPLSDSEKRQEKSFQEEKTLVRKVSLEKQSSTERSSRYGVSRKGTFFAVSRYSPATSDTESQAPKEQPKYQASVGPSTRAPSVPIRSSSLKLQDRLSKDNSDGRIQDKQSRKAQHEPLTSKVHEKVKVEKMEEMESGPTEKTSKETTFPVSGRERTTTSERGTWKKESSSSSILTKLSSPDDRHEKDSMRLSSDSDSDYRITRDGWLEKIAKTPSPANSDAEQEDKILKVTDLDSLFGGVSSLNSVTTKKSKVLDKGQTTTVKTSITTEYSHSHASNNTSAALLPSSTELQNSPHTRITPSGVQETDLDALFADEEPNDSATVETTATEETLESRTSLLRNTVVNRSGKILVSEESYVTGEKRQPLEDVPVNVCEADRSQVASVIKAIPMNESHSFGDIDDEVFSRFPEKPGVNQNGYRADGACSSDADSETSSLNSVPLKPKTRHTRSSLEAVKTSIRPLTSSLSSDSSSAAATPIPSERSDIEFEPFNSLPSSTSTPERNKRNYTERGFRMSRKATKEPGHHMRQITAEGNGLQIDSSDGAAQRITRAYSESLMGATDCRRSAFTPVRNREKERSNSQENIQSRKPEKEGAIRYNDIGSDLNTEPSFKEMADSHKSMPDLHKPQSESDAQPQKVPYHSRLSAHTRLWLSQTAGIDTSDLCNDSFGSEIFLYPSNRFQPGKSVDASFLSIASETDDIPDDVSTRPSSPMSEFSFAGETPFDGDYQGDVIVVTCGNNYCGKDEIVRSQDKTSFTSCPSCFTYYCSSECRRAHWREHKKVCYFGRINSYMRSFVYFCHKKENLKLLLSKIATKNFSSKGRGCVMVTFASPKQARKFMTGGCVLLPSPPSFSTVRQLQQEGVVSKHRVNLIQQVKDYDPYQELVLNLAIVAGKVEDFPLYPVPRHKLSTVLQCIRIPLSGSLIQRPKPVIPETNRETKVFYLPKCSRHEFVNDMEARRHYCRIISKSLKQYGVKMKKDYPSAYESLCLYVEKNIPFKPLTVYGNKDSKIVECKIMPEGYTSSTTLI